MQSKIIVEFEYSCTKMQPLGPTMSPEGSVPCWGIATITTTEGDSENPFFREWIQKQHEGAWGCTPLREGVYEYAFGEFLVSEVEASEVRRSGPISATYAIAEVGRKRMRVESLIRDKKYSPKRSYSVWGACSYGMARFTKEPLTWTQACIVIAKYRTQGCYEQLEIRRI